MQKPQFNAKEPSQERARDFNVKLDKETGKDEYSQFKKRRFAQEDNSLVQLHSDSLFERIAHNQNQQTRPGTKPAPKIEKENATIDLHHLRNAGASTAFKNNDQENPRGKIEAIMNATGEGSGYFSDRELSGAIRKICEEAYELIMGRDYEVSFQRLQKAEQLVQKYKINDPFVEFELIFFIFNNMVASCYNSNMMLEAKMYAEGSLVNLDYFKKIRKPHRPYNFQLPSDQHEYILHRKKKLTAKRFASKTHLQLALILTQFSQHTEAREHARRATRIACNLIIDTLILCYYFLYKSKAKEDERGKSPDLYGLAKGQNSDFTNFEGQLKGRKITKSSGADISSVYILDDSATSLNNSKYSDFYKQNPQESPTPAESNKQTLLKLIPVLEEFVKRIKSEKIFSSSSKRDRILAYYRHYFKDISWETPDLSCVFGGINDSDWVNSAELCHVMKLSAVSPAKTSFDHTKLESEIEPNSLMQKIVVATVGFYVVSTEVRFEKAQQEANSKSDDLTSKISDSENWLSKSIELGYLFVPHAAPFVGQMITVYKQYYSIHNQIIPEEEDLLHGFKYLRPLRGGSQSDGFIPLIRCHKGDEITKEVFTPRPPFLHEKLPPEFEPLEPKREPSQDFMSIQEYLATRFAATQTQAIPQETVYRNQSSDARAQKPVSRQLNPQQELKKSNMEKAYENARPNSKNMKNKKGPIMNLAEIHNQPTGKEFEFNEVGFKPRSSQKINNFFANDSFSFQQSNILNASNTLDVSVLGNDLDIDGELEFQNNQSHIEALERSLLGAKRSVSSQKPRRKPSPVIPDQSAGFVQQLKSNGSKRTTENPLPQQPNQRPQTNSKPRSNSPSLARKGIPDQKAAARMQFNEESLDQTPYVSSLDDDDSSLRAADLERPKISNLKNVKPNLPKFDIKINNNINVFIHNNGSIEDIFATGLLAPRYHEKHQSKTRESKLDGTRQQKMIRIPHTGTEKIKIRPVEIQRRAETDPDEPTNVSQNFPDYSKFFKNDSFTVTKSRGKSPITANRPRPASRSNVSAPKRANLSFTKESEHDRSDILNRSAIGHFSSKNGKNRPSSVERNAIPKQLSKGKQLTELEKLLKPNKSNVSAAREDNSKSPNRRPERGIVQNQPYLNATFAASTSNIPQEQKNRKFDDILRRDQLSKNITKIRTKYNQDSFDHGNIMNDVSQIEGASLWDQMRNNPKIFRTYDKP